MNPTVATETVIPLLPCASLEQTVDFYRALGFEITHQQKAPYIYAAVRRSGIELHFSSLRVYGAKNAFGALLVLVGEVGQYHRAFADGLRASYGRIPTAGLPRITRLWKGQSRFKVFDPAGNLTIYIDRGEPQIDYDRYDAGLSELAQAIDNAVFVRDTYANDKAAAAVLDAALDRSVAPEPLDYARALAIRAELAVALGEAERAQTLQAELRQLPLADRLRRRYRHELNAPEQLERWLTHANSPFGGIP